MDPGHPLSRAKCGGNRRKAGKRFAFEELLRHKNGENKNSSTYHKCNVFSHGTNYLLRIANYKLRKEGRMTNPPLKNEGRRGPRSGWAEIQ
jgi:hypothetical protein